MVSILYTQYKMKRLFRRCVIFRTLTPLLFKIRSAFIKIQSRYINISCCLLQDKKKKAFVLIILLFFNPQEAKAPNCSIFVYLYINIYICLLFFHILCILMSYCLNLTHAYHFLYFFCTVYTYVTSCYDFFVTFQLIVSCGFCLQYFVFISVWVFESIFHADHIKGDLITWSLLWALSKCFYWDILT